MILIKINVDQIDKARLFKGAKHTYLDLCLIEKNETDEYGNTHFVTQSCRKEEREDGLKMPIIGNGKEMSRREKSKPKQDEPKKWEKKTVDESDNSEIPF